MDPSRLRTLIPLLRMSAVAAALLMLTGLVVGYSEVALQNPLERAATAASPGAAVPDDPGFGATYPVTPPSAARPDGTNPGWPGRPPGPGARPTGTGPADRLTTSPGETTPGPPAPGAVVLTDDDRSRTLWNAAGLSPGEPSARCIALTYSGSRTPVRVRGFATASGPLARHLTLIIEVGRGGGFDTCRGFVADSRIYAGTLQAYSELYTGWDSGLPIFAAEATGESRTLRIVVDVRDARGAQSASAEAGFVWEARG